MKYKKPLLIDFDGVLKIAGKQAPFISSFFSCLNKKNIPHCILSNSTLSTSGTILQFLRTVNVNYEINCLTAIEAASEYTKRNFESVFPVCNDNLKFLFADLYNDVNPAAVVIGDIGKEWNFEIITKIFNFVKSGSELIAIHKNKYWSPDGHKLVPDAGLFISGLEYVTGIEAKLIGKPSKEYFFDALEKIKSKSEGFLMLGDDLESDIAGASNAGGESILILTGKSKLPIPENINYKPDFIAKDLNEVNQILEKLYD